MLKQSIVFVVAVLLTFSSASIALAAEPPNQESEQTIVDIAVADGRFTTLVTAVQAADLVDTLNSDGPFTVFAPTDDAFAALPAGTVESLLGDIPALTDILLYHVVPGKVMAADVVTLSSADTALGKPVQITTSGGEVMINDAKVIITDIEASNGVIHVIDAVLIPPADEDSTTMVPQAETQNSQPAPKNYGQHQQYQQHNQYGHNVYRNYNRAYYGNSYYCPPGYNNNYYGRSYYNHNNYNRAYYGHHYNRGYYGYNNAYRGYYRY